VEISLKKLDVSTRCCDVATQTARAKAIDVIAGWSLLTY